MLIKSDGLIYMLLSVYIISLFIIPKAISAFKFLFKHLLSILLNEVYTYIIDTSRQLNYFPILKAKLFISIITIMSKTKVISLISPNV